MKLIQTATKKTATALKKGADLVLGILSMLMLVG